MPQKSFKVIIVGGSIAGLTLALILERNDIDFVVLEGYPSIAPQVGASIGMSPNGLRILDQLGCCDAVLQMAEHPVDKFICRDSSGHSFWSLDNCNEESTECHGYPIVFLDRQMLIQILYDKIQDKSKIITSQRVATMKHVSDQVMITTTAEKTYIGDIIVGADGIHSTVRRQMWEEMRRMDPTLADSSEENALPAKYACIFGISKGVEGVEKGTLTSVFNEGFSYLIPSGPGDRTYWFLLTSMGKTFYGPEIPRFTKQDEELLVKKHWNDNITPTLRFSQLYETRVSSVYTTLPEYVYKRWYFKRIMIIGDAAHKLGPITGQGGNSAIETAASFGNHLVRTLISNKSNLTTEEITCIFENVQQQRRDRVLTLLQASYDRQRLEAMDTPTLSFVARYVFPYLPVSVGLADSVHTYCPAVSLDMVPIPKQPRKIPYYDELLRNPVPRGSVSKGWHFVGVGALAWLLYCLLATARENQIWSLIKHATSLFASLRMDISLSELFARNRSFTEMYQYPASIASALVTNQTTVQNPPMLYMLTTALPLSMIFTIEGSRPKNEWTPLALPTLWATLCQFCGVGFVVPVYLLVHAFVSRDITYFSPTTRALPTCIIKSLIPALFTGYLIVSIPLLAPLHDAFILQEFIYFARVCPVLVPTLTRVFSWAITLRAWLLRDGPSKNGKYNTDLAHLNVMYKSIGVLSAVSHLALLHCCLFSDQLHMANKNRPEQLFVSMPLLADVDFSVLSRNSLAAAASLHIYCCFHVWDLYRVGMSNVTFLYGFGAITLGLVLVGPGATAAAIWCWREHVMSGKHIKSLQRA